ncbi:hypothetical protein PQX77_015829 [Marasmius sp. AFHP31]|nr:hypothetical protein PQX77_015829 [Marasmius sp. AFHP31]
MTLSCWKALLSEATRRFIELVKVKGNAEIIREELRAITHEDNGDDECDEYDEGEDDEDNYAFGPSPSPFTGFNGSRALNVEDAPYSDDNDEGLTIFDIADPNNPAYCHDLSRAGPFSATEYCERSLHEYYLDQGLFDYFDQVKVIPGNALAETWPGTFAGSSSPSPSMISSQDQVPVPTLADLTLAPAIQQVAESGEPSFEFLEPFLRLPEKAASILNVLRDMNSRLRRDTAFYKQPGVLGLIKRIVEAHHNIINPTDLTIPSNRLIEILSILKASHRIQYLNLSHNKHVSIQTIRAVLEAHPRIHRLVLYGTSISGGDLNSMLERERHLFFGVDELIHPLLFSLDNRTRRYPAFSFFFSRPGCLSSTHFAVSLASSPLLTPSVVLQSVADLFKSWIAALGMSESERFDYGHVAKSMPMLSGGAADYSDKPWYQRPVICSSFASDRAFSEGWMFVLVLAPELDPSKVSRLYGFIRGNQVYDLTSFVLELKAEGYPEPPASLVQEIEKLEERLKELVSRSRSELCDYEFVPTLLPLTEGNLNNFRTSEALRSYVHNSRFNN